jgi:hypothetical protein
LLLWFLQVPSGGMAQEHAQVANALPDVEEAAEDGSENPLPLTPPPPRTEVSPVAGPNVMTKEMKE